MTDKSPNTALPEMDSDPARRENDAIGVVTRFNDALNRRDVDGMLRLMTADCVFDNTHPDGTRYAGQAEVRAFWQDFFHGSQQARIQTEQIFSLGER
jgi:ketosteroid isomerase-like protein